MPATHSAAAFPCRCSLSRSAAPATLALFAVLALAAPPRAAAEEPRVVEIVAKRFQFTPSEVTLKKDEPVILRLRSEDVTHGFYMKKLGIDATIAPGQTTDVPLTPHEAGRFVTICDHFCGAGHGNMKMTLKVE
jgi:cytochrome c oxidase subunit 2